MITLAKVLNGAPSTGQQLELLPGDLKYTLESHFATGSALWNFWELFRHITATHFTTTGRVIVWRGVMDMKVCASTNS